jgi:hypothetical protein
LQDVQVAPQRENGKAVVGVNLRQKLDHLLTRVGLIANSCVQAIEEKHRDAWRDVAGLVNLIRVRVRRQAKRWICRTLVCLSLKDLDFLRTAVIEHNEVRPCQVFDGFALLIRGDHADLNQACCGSNQPSRRRRTLLLAGYWPLLGWA